MRRILLFLIILPGVMHAQEYSDYKIRYDNFAGDDLRAFQHLNPSIAKAKKEKNYEELFQTYKDAIHFSPTQKISYADSAIWAASLTKDSDLIGTSYLTKGTVYYFNYRKFKPALDEYLKAWKYIEKSDNQYLFYKNLYHIGVVKSYLGYYAEALEIFKKCEVFFKRVPTSSAAPNIQYNRRKGYLNTLHQTASCLIKGSRLEEAKSVIEKGLAHSGTQADFYLERSYFYQLKGIIANKELRDSAAISALDTSLPGLEKKNDFTHSSIAYYYKGKSYSRLGKEEGAIQNFVKVDSIFRQYAFVLPEVRPSYEFLISYYHKLDNKEKELYYTGQLLKVDHVLMSDFQYLSGKMHKDYDTADLLAAKRKLEHSVSFLSLLGWLAVLAVIILIFVLYRKNRKRGGSIGGHFEAENKSLPTAFPKVAAESHPKVPPAVTIAVLAELEVMERKNFFVEKGMSLHKLAPQLHTNSTYLSHIIKEHRGCHFNTYLRQKRIAFITERLRESSKWRNYSIETLAAECGFADRNNFTNAFLEYNHVRPLDYIRHLNEARDEKQ